MKAIVLTFDKYHPIADHMIHSYENLWPSNPFTFYVPYEKYPVELAKRYGDKIRLVQKKVGIDPKLIKYTVLFLLEELEDEQWIYWCMDDRYIEAINENEVNKVYNWLISTNDAEISAISFCRYRELYDEKYVYKDQELINSFDQVFVRRKNYIQIYSHQFLRVKVLRYLFKSFPDRPFNPHEMDKFIQNRYVPGSHKLNVSAENLVVFGESTSRGNITRNCANSFKRFGMKIPDGFVISERNKIKGISN